MMISQELYIAERLLDERVKMMWTRNNATNQGRVRATGRKGRRFLGWASLSLVSLGARMVGYGLPAHRSHDGQAA